MGDFKTEALAEGFGFLEGPRWRDGRLWMSDFIRSKVFTLDPDGRVEPVVEVPGSPSGLGFLPDGTPLIVSMKDRRLLRLEGAGLVCHAELGPLVTGEANDMVVDAEGRAGRSAPSQCEMVTGPVSHHPISPIKSGPRPVVTAQGRIHGRMPILLPLSAIGGSHLRNPA